MKQSERPSYQRWYAANKERLIKKAVERNKANAEARRIYQRKWYAENAERLRPVKRADAQRSYARNSTVRAAKAKDTRQQLRQLFISAYGGACACCGEDTYEFLTLEHKNRDGAAHRAAVGNTAHAVLLDLQKRNWPKDDYELLCFNCNRASWLGVCPHRQEQAA
jgi:hypothetical protein